ncbi:MAG: 3-deoxy-manno-octulosonate cytidylyltransferase, partial [Gammaproteobacteria bacterium]|nr:3-deoxy-manno-octulosonate cytidylyltransferase [Gammaproteobacteria bacterium]
NIVKIALSLKPGETIGRALYFSRAPIPWQRGVFQHGQAPYENTPLQADTFYRHIGLYAYRVGFIKNYVQWPIAPLEEIEQLEQLRVLARGERIAIEAARAKSPIGVDTEADLAFARQFAEQRQSER